MRRPGDRPKLSPETAAGLKAVVSDEEREEYETLYAPVDPDSVAGDQLAELYNKTARVVDLGFNLRHTMRYDPAREGDKKYLYGLDGYADNPDRYTYDAETVRLMIVGYRGIIRGDKPRFACNPNPSGGAFK